MEKKNGCDVVLINPGDRKQIYQSLGDKLSALQTPDWLGYIATFLRKKEVSVLVIDANAENLTPDETAQRVVDLNPVLTAMVVYGHQPSASTQVMPSARAICTSIKKRSPTLKILMVGGHVASLPKRTLEEENTDFVCDGEGPYTTLELLQCLKSNQGDYKKVRGLWYRDGNEIVSNPPAPLVTNLDEEMPGLAYDLLPMNLYRAHNWHCFGNLPRQPYASLYTTLGCPYKCTFCCIQSPFKSGEKVLGMQPNINSYRFWSPQEIIRQIDILVNQYGIRNLRFSDEMFVLNMKHVNAIADLIIERKYDLNIWVYARVDIGHDDPKTTEKLKRAGFNWFCFGIESANAKVRDDVQKGFTQDKIIAAVKKVRSKGINVIGNYMFGLPEDNLETMQETFDLATELNCEFASFYTIMIYPGSQLYKEALKRGLPLPENWEGYSLHSEYTLPLPTQHLSGPEALKFRDQAWQKYFTSPRYLNMIKEKFGQKTVGHIQEMTSHKLIRKYIKN